MVKKNTTVYLYSVTFLILLISCAKNPIKIGMTATLSGGTSELGIAVRSGAQIAIEDLAKQGVKAELIVRDDKANLEEGTKQLKLLAEEGVKLIMGHLSSGATSASLPEANKQGIILLSPTSNADRLFGIKDALFLLMPSADAMGAAAAAYASGKLGKKRVALVGDIANEIFTASYIKGFSDRFEQGGGVVVFNETLPDEKTGILQAAAKRIMERSPDCIVLTTDVKDTSLLAQQLGIAGYNGILVGSDGSMDPALATNGGDIVQGMLFPSLYNAVSPSERMKRFNQDYAKRFGTEPSDIARLGWEAFTIFATAAKDGTDPEKVRSNLLSTEFSILEGTVKFNETGEAQRQITLLKLQGKAFVPAP